MSHITYICTCFCKCTKIISPYLTMNAKLKVFIITLFTNIPIYVMAQTITRDYSINFMAQKPFHTTVQSATEPTENPIIPVLNEIMANPLKGASEYIELYNPTTQKIDLSGYAIAIGDKETGSYGGKRVLNNIGIIMPKSFIVITSSPEGVKNFYTQAPKDLIRSFKQMPQLPNKGFMLCLVRLEDNMIVDEVLYSPSLFEKGLRSKRGIALERIKPNPKEDYENNWASALAKNNYATPGMTNSRLGSKPNINPPQNPDINEPEKGEQSAYLFEKDTASPEAIARMILEYTQQDSQFKCSTHIYTIEGMGIVHANGTTTYQWAKLFDAQQRVSFASFFNLPPGRYIVSVKMIPSATKAISRYFLLDI